MVTHVIFATFTFIFFALEGSIMAQGLELGLGLPLWLGYAASTIITLVCSLCLSQDNVGDHVLPAQA